MNNEPVAWMELYKGEFNNLYKNWFDCKDKGEWSAIPLYIHPVKELTDKITEQEKFIKAILKKGGCDGNICQKYNANPVKELTDEVKDALMDALLGWKYIRECHGDLYGVGWDRVQDKLEAILKKAQEK